MCFISNEIKAYNDEKQFANIKTANTLKDNKCSFNKGLEKWHFCTYNAGGNIKCWSLSRQEPVSMYQIIKTCMPFDPEIPIVSVYLEEIIRDSNEYL